MKSVVTIAIVGLGAQLVDGTLGMAYGVTSTTLLLTAGYAPAVASASVHLAEIGTTLASGAAHWRFGNVNWQVVRNIGIPGAIGAFAGATFLSSLSTERGRPVDGRHPAGARRLPAAAVRHQGADPGPRGPAAQALPRPARPVRRLRRRHRRRRLGTGRHPDPDQQRQDDRRAR